MANSVKFNIVYSIGYNLLNVLAPFIILPYVARILQVENLGLYSYYNTIAYYFVLFTLLGLVNYGSRSIAAVRDRQGELSKTFSEIYYMQIIMSILLVIVYILWSLYFSAHPIISLLLSLYVISAGFDISWFYSGLEEFNILFKRNLVIKIFNLVCVFLFVKDLNDLPVYVFIMSAGFLLGNITMWHKLYSRIHFCKVNLKDVLKHVKSNLILFIPVIAISIYNAMDTIMLGGLSSMEEVGYFDNAIKIVNIPQVIIAAIGAVMLPKVSNLLANCQIEALLTYLKFSIVTMACLSALISYGLIIIAPEFIQMYLGNEFSKCVTLLYFLIPCMVFKAYANVVRTQYIIPQKEDKIYVKSVCGGAVLNFVINLFIIPIFQSIGACITTIIAEIFVCLYQLVYVVKKEKILKEVLLGFGFQLIGIVSYILVVSIDYHGGIFTVLVYKSIFYLISFSLLFYVYSRITKINHYFSIKIRKS